MARQVENWQNIKEEKESKKEREREKENKQSFESD